MAALRGQLQARLFSSTGRLVHSRRFTTSRCYRADPPAADVAAAFLSRFQSPGPQTRTQVLDANQLQLLSLTLNRPSLFPGSTSLSNTSTGPPVGTPVPPGYHLVYFTPAFLETELGPDGTDSSYNPEPPFTRRMWAGGEVLWPRGPDGKTNPLRVGQQVHETTRVLSAAPKIVKKTGEDMIVVGVEKEFANEHGVSIVDRRNWVFRKAISPSTAPAAQDSASLSTAHTAPGKSSTISTQGNTHIKALVQTPVTLFRFSALTFNPHKIHYSLPWARDVEGHKDIVVHGPLNLISILDMWRDLQGKRASDPTSVVPRRISYRATSPLYAGDEYQIVMQEDANLATVQILAPGGAVAMKAEIEGA